MAGLFITFEGSDGSGKTTQVRLLAQWLRTEGVEAVMLRQPGGTALGERIRALLLDSRGETVLGRVDARAELALMFADRAQSLREVVYPALREGRVVLCDRYTDSTEAYQGWGRGLGPDAVLEMHRLLCDNLWPDRTIMLLPDVEAALGRARERNEAFRREHGGADENRFEAEGEAFFRRVCAGYQAIATREPKRVHAIRDGDIESVASDVREVVSRLLDGRKGRS